MPTRRARAARWLCHQPHVRGKSRLEELVLRATPLGEGMVRVPFPDGFVMTLDTSSAFERDFYFRSCEPDTRWFLQRELRPGDVFADCGANLGFYTLLGSRLVGPGGVVLAFEPTPAVFERLEGHVAANAAANVRPFRLALGDHAHEAPVFQLREFNHGLNTLATSDDDPGEAVGTTKVERLDDVLGGTDVPPPRVLKVDVEGSELSLLRGATDLLGSVAPPTLVVELSRFTSRAFDHEPEDVVTHVLTSGPYELLWLHDRRLVPVAPGERLPHYAALGELHGSNYVFRPRL